MAITLVEAAKKYQNDVFRQAVIELYAQSTELLSVLPFEDVPGGALKYDQEGALPGIGFRGVNEGYSESTGVLNPQMEPLVIAGGDLDVDKFILKTRGEGVRSSQESMKLKALSQFWSNQFIKGDSQSTPKAFDGLQVRLVGPQLLDAGSASGGDALSLAKLDELIDQVEAPTHLVMNKTMKRLLTQAARTSTVSGFINWTTDAFGRRITHYNDIPIITMGNLGDVYNTLDFVEANPGGGSNVGTSIYCVSFAEDRLCGIQNGDPEVNDLGELEGKPSKRTRVEWYNGIAMFNPRCAARLRGIKSAAVVA